MTVACALIHNGETWLGSDRLTVLGEKEKMLGPPKWIISRDRSAALAASGSGLAGNLIRENAEQIFTSSSNGGARGVLNAAFACFKIAGWEPHRERDNPPSYDCDLLYAVPGFIFHLSGYSVIRLISDPWYATGSGDMCALSAFHALAPTDADAQTRVLAAVTAAIRYDLHCGGEPWVERL